MRTILMILACVLAATVTAAAARSDELQAGHRGVFSGVKVGDRVALKDLGTAWEITLVTNGLPLSHQVVAVGPDHVVVRDGTGVVETKIPVYAVKAVVRRKRDGPGRGAGR